MLGQKEKNKKRKKKREENRREHKRCEFVESSLLPCVYSLAAIVLGFSCNKCRFSRSVLAAHVTRQWVQLYFKGGKRERDG